LGIVADWSDEEADNPLRVDDRNFYRVEKWTKDNTKIERMLYAGKRRSTKSSRCLVGA
jgi:hypothetical protein